MNINDAYPRNYLKSGDLQGRDVAVTIDSVTIEDLGDETKPVLRFQGKQKGMVLNKTNSQIISEMYGEETDLWIGKPLTLHVEKVPYQGRLVDGLRVRYVAQQPVAPGPYTPDQSGGNLSHLPDEAVNGTPEEPPF